MEESKNIVMYHGNCTDGWGAAYAAWKKFGDEALYIPMDHAVKRELPDLTDKNVFILDFSFSPEVYQSILSKANKVTLLDHHKSAKDCLECYDGTHFDLTKSGAVLAWEHFFPLEPVPLFMKLIQDMDLWQFKYPETQAFYMAISSFPQDFKYWSQLEDMKFLGTTLKDGELLRKFFNSQLDDIEKSAKPVILDGVEGLMLNANGMFASDIGNRLAKKSGTFALIWQEKADHIKCGLRSVDSFDASKIALKFGGGGHPQSCAFTTPDLQSFLYLIENEALNFSKPITAAVEKRKVSR